MSEVRLAAEHRTEFGKGAARRTRRAGKIPAVLYGHGTEPQHVALPALEFARVLREQGTNAVLSLDLGSASPQLALTKTVTTHPLRNYIEHVDLLLVRRGEKVVIDVPVTFEGEAAGGALVTQELDTVQVEADALSIPENFTVSVQDAEAGTQITAAQVALPAGVELRSDPETLLVNVVGAPTEADLEATMDVEGAGVVEDAPEAAPEASSEAAADGTPAEQA